MPRSKLIASRPLRDCGAFAIMEPGMMPSEVNDGMRSYMGQNRRPLTLAEAGDLADPIGVLRRENVALQERLDRLENTIADLRLCVISAAGGMFDPEWRGMPDLMPATLTESLLGWDSTKDPDTELRAQVIKRNPAQASRWATVK